MYVITVNGSEFIHGTFESRAIATDYAMRCDFYRGYEVVELIKPVDEETESDLQEAMK